MRFNCNHFAYYVKSFFVFLIEIGSWNFFLVCAGNVMVIVCVASLLLLTFSNDIKRCWSRSKSAWGRNLVLISVNKYILNVLIITHYNYPQKMFCLESCFRNLFFSNSQVNFRIGNKFLMIKSFMSLLIALTDPCLKDWTLYDFI